MGNLNDQEDRLVRTFAYPSAEAEAFLAKKGLDDQDVAARVQEVIERVRTEGVPALFAYTERFDGARITEENFRVSAEAIAEAYQQVDPEVLAALRRAAENIRRFHEKQMRPSWLEPEADGTILGQLIRPLERVGIYVPGGLASYPSSVLMNAIPAKVAGVPQIVMATPPGKDGSINPYTLVAAAEAGVDEIYRMGGAQAVAALAHGVGLPAVDKITGPGNIYVTLAKKQVYGTVDIDMLAGPSEILVIADENASSDYVAADFLSQVEHDVRAAAVLVTPSAALATAVKKAILEQMSRLPRREIMEQALRDNGAIIIVDSLLTACEVANRFAPEHLEVLTDEPFQWLGSLQQAGAIFLGPYSPEPVGDYYAGPNHVLPTGGTARFYSPLNIDTFMKKTSVIAYSRARFVQAAPDILALAQTEGLDAHAHAIALRLSPTEKGSQP
ncbi:histidinol dehydrogenase [Heliophilum fasciatum]|uniref:Histidinol dehydrogenase n=1 Tax=Heliophilum fasciatum TaxID=35700 RepID=A0A4R2RKF1_9FIRM|nr:histidinol dehydrogenase [Heliophilum fasciatum]MCW2278020.1 histidinol dehydrogenase [Heliophilum fasciatum]TCP64360.1 histidinol dehydrogenase [Heliophilum fasciatum]